MHSVVAFGVQVVLEEVCKALVVCLNYLNRIKNKITKNNTCLGLSHSGKMLGK